MIKATCLLTTFSSSFLLVLACSGRDVQGTGQQLVGMGDGGSAAAVEMTSPSAGMGTSGTTEGSVTNPGAGESTITNPDGTTTIDPLEDGVTRGEGGTSAGTDLGAGGIAGINEGVGIGECGDGELGYSVLDEPVFKSTGGAPASFPVSEGCDDGNNDSGDGCDATCQPELGWACTPDGPCHEARCGDGFVDSYDQDAAHSVLKIVAPAPTGTAGTSAGPSTIHVQEMCDDGNTASGDGCDASCDLEVGWTCPAPGEECHEPSCGDGVREDYVSPGDPVGAAAFAPLPPAEGGAGNVPTGSSGASALLGEHAVYETCDDGNREPGDGCDALCEKEDGYNCPAAGGACDTPKCGDGVLDGHYDGLVRAVDYPGGFTSDTGTGGWVSVGGAGSTGEWIGEACDDGNLESGDGCSETCELEVSL